MYLILSWPCIPYVIGYSLSYAQMLELAPRLCTPKQLALFPDHPQVALNQYMASSNKREAFLPYNEADGFVFYLWIQGVLPSFNGKKPPIRVRPVNLERNPSLAGLRPAKGRGIKWPIYLAGTCTYTPTLSM
jgi:hypothetical protein